MVAQCCCESLDGTSGTVSFEQGAVSFAQGGKRCPAAQEPSQVRSHLAAEARSDGKSCMRVLCARRTTLRRQAVITLSVRGLGLWHQCSAVCVCLFICLRLCARARLCVSKEKGDWGGRHTAELWCDFLPRCQKITSEPGATMSWCCFAVVSLAAAPSPWPTCQLSLFLTARLL